MPRKKNDGSEDDGDVDDNIENVMGRDEWLRVRAGIRQVIDEDLEEEVEDEVRDEVARVVGEFINEDADAAGGGRGLGVVKANESLPDLEGTIAVMAFFAHFILGPPNAMPNAKAF